VSSLGERIRARRKELGLTQSQLGGSDLTKGFISLVEKGRARPSLETLVLLARRLQKPVGYFLEEGTVLGRQALQLMLASAWVALKRSEFTQAAERFSEALQVAQQQHDESAEAESSIGLGSALAGVRQFDLARENVERGKALAEAAAASFHLARVSHVLGLIEYDRRNLPAAREHFLEGYRRVREFGHPDVSLAGSLLLNLGNTYQEIGDYVEAARWYREALRTLEPTEDMHCIGLAHVQLGIAHRESGNIEAALEHLMRAEHIFELLEDVRLLAQARTSIGIMLLERGEIDDAIAHLERSLRIKERLGDDPGRARTLTELARAFIAKRAFPSAEQALAEAERLSKTAQDVTEGARILVTRARLHRGMGRAQEAARHYKQAIAAMESLDMRPDLAHACNELGELLLEQKRPSEAAPYLARALQEMRVEKAMGRHGDVPLHGPGAVRGRV
jgi:tetratricopeptide (TPR) repeat protein